MRWISLDQKPSWFNNAGHAPTYMLKGVPASVKEDFAKPRQRYSILTTVSSCEETMTDAPKLCVLFKGAPNGSIKSSLERDFDKPDWMKLLVQENGSFRSEDMVQALDWILPQADDAQDVHPPTVLYFCFLFMNVTAHRSSSSFHFERVAGSHPSQWPAQGRGAAAAKFCARGDSSTWSSNGLLFPVWAGQRMWRGAYCTFEVAAIGILTLGQGLNNHRSS